MSSNVSVNCIFELTLNVCDVAVCMYNIIDVVFRISSFSMHRSFRIGVSCRPAEHPNPVLVDVVPWCSCVLSDRYVMFRSVSTGTALPVTVPGTGSLHNKRI